MKLKHIIILILIILISTVVFYFGWIQIKLPENTYGIGFTKTNGYLKDIYEPGKFSWELKKLIPGNFKLLKFKLYSQQLNVNKQIQLPSGKIYSDYLPGKPDFSFCLKYFLTFQIKPNDFPLLVKELSLNPDQMDQKYKSMTADIELFISNYYKNKAQNTNIFADVFYKSDELSTELLSSLSKEYPHLSFSKFIPVNIVIPDTVLYKKAKELYYASLDMQNNIISKTKTKIAEQEIIDNANFETLKKYGELLKQYPSLIDLFSVMNIDASGIIPQPNLELPKNDPEE